METILQFGAGRFLRAFFDRFVQHANDSGQNVGRIVVVQSTPGERAELINRQPDGYTVLVRGYEDEQLVERTEKVASLKRALVAATQWPQVLELAKSPELRYIVSNATEAGYHLAEGDGPDSNPPQSLPAKLTQVLWHRFQAKQPPLVLLPCELFEGNAAKLLELVAGQARAWKLPADFERWLRDDCIWMGSLVDCIITSPPADHPLAAQDKLLVCAEPYALWALQKPAGKQPKLFTNRALHLVDDVTPYFLRKVRMLNGLHTAMVCKFQPQGMTTVQEVMANRDATRWLLDLLYEEIVPTIAYRVDGAAEFAAQTWDRLRNPFIVHKLSDIALHHADKIRVRLTPTFEEYQRLFGKSPRKLSEIIKA